MSKPNHPTTSPRHLAISPTRRPLSLSLYLRLMLGLTQKHRRSWCLELCPFIFRGFCPLQSASLDVIGLCSSAILSVNSWFFFPSPQHKFIISFFFLVGVNFSETSKISVNLQISNNCLDHNLKSMMDIGSLNYGLLGVLCVCLTNWVSHVT